MVLPQVEYNQVSCVAKCMHEELLDPGNQFQETINKYYGKACQLLASFYHPNIVKFIGLYFVDDSEVPLLVMEKLPMSVSRLLENSTSIPLSLKISILTDTCSGLDYLHSMPSPIVHGDLTARNVLLTSCMSAKITDIANTHLVTVRPGSTSDYMPPEIVQRTSSFNEPAIDVFSFGNLALYVLTQVIAACIIGVKD